MPEELTHDELEEQYQKKLQADWARQRKPKELVDLEKHLAKAQKKNWKKQQPSGPESNFVSDEASMATQFNEEKSMAKRQLEQAGKKILADAGKKVASAVWKKVMVRFILPAIPYILGFLGIVLIIFIVISLTLYLKCEMVNRAGILKPILDLAGFTCEVQ